MTSGADLAIAYGTIGTAVVAVVGLFISFLINRNDRNRANQQAIEDRNAAARLSAANVAAVREDAARRHIVDLLLELGREIASNARTFAAPVSYSRPHIVLLLNALPAECAWTARKKLDAIRIAQVPGAVGQKLGWLDLASKTPAQLTVDDLTAEIAFDIDRYLTSGQPPEAVWIDLDDLRAWERRRWPRA